MLSDVESIRRYTVEAVGIPPRAADPVDIVDEIIGRLPAQEVERLRTMSPGDRVEVGSAARRVVVVRRTR